MPTVLTIFALRVAIYPKDHRPAHVHVMGGGCEAVFNLQCPNGPPELRENFGFSRKTLLNISAVLADELAMLCDEWRQIHEYYLGTIRGR